MPRLRPGVYRAFACTDPLQALEVTIVGALKSANTNASWLPALFGPAALVDIITGALGGHLPRQMGIVSVIANAVAFVTYAVGKGRASRNAWRLPGANLHIIGLCGGWPGALAAQHLLRHKNRKPEFQITFRGTIVLDIGALVFWKSIFSV